MFLFFAPSVVLSKPKKHKQNEDDEKDENQRKQQNENAEGNPKKTAAGRERRMNRLLGSHMEDCSASDEHKELENARKEANNMRSNVPEMTTGAVKRRIRVLKAGAAPGPSGLRNNHIRAITAAPGGLRAIVAWIAAWTKGKQGHQEMKAWNAALIVPHDREH